MLIVLPHLSSMAHRDAKYVKDADEDLMRTGTKIDRMRLQV